MTSYVEQSVLKVISAIQTARFTFNFLSEFRLKYSARDNC